MSVISLEISRPSPLERDTRVYSSRSNTLTTAMPTISTTDYPADRAYRGAKLALIQTARVDDFTGRANGHDGPAPFRAPRSADNPAHGPRPKSGVSFTSSSIRSHSSRPSARCSFARREQCAASLNGAFRFGQIQRGPIDLSYHGTRCCCADRPVIVLQRASNRVKGRKPCRTEKPKHDHRPLRRQRSYPLHRQSPSRMRKLKKAHPVTDGP